MRAWYRLSGLATEASQIWAELNPRLKVVDIGEVTKEQILVRVRQYIQQAMKTAAEQEKSGGFPGGKNVTIKPASDASPEEVNSPTGVPLIGAYNKLVENPLSKGGNRQLTFGDAPDVGLTATRTTESDPAGQLEPIALEGQEAEDLGKYANMLAPALGKIFGRQGLRMLAGYPGGLSAGVGHLVALRGIGESLRFRLMVAIVAGEMALIGLGKTTIDKILASGLMTQVGSVDAAGRLEKYLTRYESYLGKGRKGNVPRMAAPFTDKTLDKKFTFTNPEGRRLSSNLKKAEDKFKKGEIDAEEFEKYKKALEEGKKNYRESHEQPEALMEKAFQSLVDLLVGKGLITLEDGEEPVLEDVLEKIHVLFGDSNWLLNIFRLDARFVGDDNAAD
jgi:hypothetical protein